MERQLVLMTYRYGVCLGGRAVEFLTQLFNMILESEKMPKECRKIVLVLMFKKKGDVILLKRLER